MQRVLGYAPGAITIGNVNVSTGFDMPGNQNPFIAFARNLYTYTDSVQVIKGKHQISAGVWFQRIQDNDNYPLRAAGSASFASIPAFFQGLTQSFQIAPKTTANGWRSWEGAWYVQDSIQLRPNHVFDIDAHASVARRLGGFPGGRPAFSPVFPAGLG